MINKVYDFLYFNSNEEREKVLIALKNRFSLSAADSGKIYKKWRCDFMKVPFKSVKTPGLKINARDLKEYKSDIRVSKRGTKVPKKGLKVPKKCTKVPNLIESIDIIGFNKTVLKYGVVNPGLLRKIYEKVRVVKNE